MTHLRNVLPADWRATLVAVDGATTHDIPAQIRRIPRDATHIAVSVGGNDALGHFDLLSSRVASTAEALDLFDDRLARFEADYRRALREVVKVERPTIVCTIYNGALPDPDEARRARRALAFFNDAIVRAAWELSSVIVDLRLVCSEAADYANPIEPSGTGGAKIARSLARAVGALPPAEPCAYAPYQPRV